MLLGSVSASGTQGLSGVPSTGLPEQEGEWPGSRLCLIRRSHRTYQTDSETSLRDDGSPSWPRCVQPEGTVSNRLDSCMSSWHVIKRTSVSYIKPEHDTNMLGERKKTYKNQQACEMSKIGLGGGVLYGFYPRRSSLPGG